MRSAALRYWHTIRYLRPVQVFGRVWFRLVRPRPDLAPAPEARVAAATWQPCSRKPSLTAPFRFRFLSVEREISCAADWNRPDWSKLWLYNAHYFDDLVAEGAVSRTEWHRCLIARWMADNSPGHGNGWEPYPLSLRIVNWVKWVLAGHSLDQAALQSLAVQARYLRRRLEVHLLGNHLLANAKALLFAGTFFQGAEAQEWRDKGRKLLLRELPEQILPDGGHFERSPMYHAILLEDVLDLLQLAKVYPDVFAETEIALWRDTACRMLEWLRMMCHPDGDIALFNDAALGIAAHPSALSRYAEVIGLHVDPSPRREVEALTASGYVRMEAGPAVLIADVGEIGPDYVPAHAHADTLSFELSLYGKRVMVNGGTATYAPGPERLAQRGTAMHNTVQIDGVDSSEVWSSFRVARRARPLDVQWTQGDEVLCLRAGHDGYRRLKGKPTHYRQWRLTAGDLSVTDTIEGRFRDAVARYRFHPGVRVHAIDASRGTLTLTDGRLLHWQVEGGEARVIGGAYHPQFGVAVCCDCIEVGLLNDSCTFRLRWGSF